MSQTEFCLSIFPEQQNAAPYALLRGKMSNWQHNLIIRVVQLVAVTLSVNNKTYAAESTSSLPIGLADVIKSYRKHIPSTDLYEGIHSKALAQASADSRRLIGPYNLETKGEINSKDYLDRKYEAVVKKKIALGISSETISTRYNAEAEGEALTIKSELAESEREIANLFISVKQKQRKFVETSKFSAVLSVLLQNTKKAARMGTISGFFVTKWDLYADGLASELEQTRSAYESLVRTLNEQTGIEIARDPEKASFKPVAHHVEVLDVTTSPVVKRGEFQELALNSRIAQTREAWDMELGLGIAHEVANRSNAVVFEVAIPLGTAAAAASEISSLESEKSMNRAETKLRTQQVKQKYKIVLMNIADQRKSLEILEKRTRGLVDLRARAESLFRQGQGDVSELLEISRELFETTLKAAETTASLDQQILEATYLVTGDIL